VLLGAGFSVTFRPHPMSHRQSAGKLQAIVSEFSSHPGFSLDENIAAHAALVGSDIMITDWSGIAFEYAFALFKPILFIDVPPKVRNPEYLEVSGLPLEVELREQLGGVLPLTAIAEAPARIKALISTAMPHRERLKQLRDRCVFNVGRSAEAGAAAIHDILRGS